MLITIDRMRFNTAVQQVHHAVNSRTPIPILTGILFIADENGLTLAGSNSDISIQTKIPPRSPAEAEEEEPLLVHRPGKVVLPARYTAEIIRRLDGEKLTIEVSANYTAKITSGKTEVLLNGLDPEEYPALPGFDWENDPSIVLSSNLLKTLIQQTVFAVAESETRPILTGVCWEMHEGRLRLTATNSHRLAKKETPIEANVPPFEQVIIPGKSLNELLKLIEGEESVEIAFTQNQILAKGENWLFTSRRLEGFYPDTSRIIPQFAKTEVLISNRILHDAINRAYLFAREIKNNVVKCSIQEGQPLVITADSPAVGQVTEEVPILGFSGESAHLAFNARYMLEALRAIDSENVQLFITGPMSPFILRPEADDSLIQLILPVRTN